MRNTIWIIIVLLIVLLIIAYLSMSNNQSNTVVVPPVSTGTIETSPATSSSNATSSIKPKTVSVVISNFAFVPPMVTINRGDSIKWTNQDQVTHNVVASGWFTSPNMGSGKTFTYTFTKAGTINYICSIHPNMQGQIIVK